MDNLNLMQRLRRLHCLRGQSNNYLRFARLRLGNLNFVQRLRRLHANVGLQNFLRASRGYLGNLSLNGGLFHTSPVVVALPHARTTLLALAVGPSPPPYCENPPSWGPDPIPPPPGG